MRGIKIHQQDFALKRQGGLCARGGVFAGYYGTCTFAFRAPCIATVICPEKKFLFY